MADVARWIKRVDADHNVIDVLHKCGVDQKIRIGEWQREDGASERPTWLVGISEEEAGKIVYDRMGHMAYCVGCNDYAYFKKGRLTYDELAEALGFKDWEEMSNESEPVYDEAGLITWFVTRLKDGAWIAWDDDEIDLVRVVFFRTREEAVSSLEKAWEISYPDEDEDVDDI